MIHRTCGAGTDHDQIRRRERHLGRIALDHRRLWQVLQIGPRLRGQLHLELDGGHPPGGAGEMRENGRVVARGGADVDDVCTDRNLGIGEQPVVQRRLPVVEPLAGNDRHHIVGVQMCRIVIRRHHGGAPQDAHDRPGTVPQEFLAFHRREGGLDPGIDHAGHESQLPRMGTAHGGQLGHRELQGRCRGRRCGRCRGAQPHGLPQKIIGVFAKRRQGPVIDPADKGREPQKNQRIPEAVLDAHCDKFVHDSVQCRRGRIFTRFEQRLRGLDHGTCGPRRRGGRQRLLIELRQRAAHQRKGQDTLVRLTLPRDDPQFHEPGGECQVPVHHAHRALADPIPVQQCKMLQHLLLDRRLIRRASLLQQSLQVSERLQALAQIDGILTHVLRMTRPPGLPLPLLLGREQLLHEIGQQRCALLHRGTPFLERMDQLAQVLERGLLVAFQSMYCDLDQLEGRCGLSVAFPPGFGLHLENAQQ